MTAEATRIAATATAPAPAGLRRWASAGLTAGLALGAAMLGLRILFGVASLPEVAHDRLLDLLPGPLFAFLIARLQFWAKPLLIVGWLAGQAGAGALAGLALGLLAQRRPGLLRGRSPLSLGLAAGGVAWATVYLLLLPLLGLGALGAASGYGVGPSLWALLPFALFGVLLVAGGLAPGRAPRPRAAAGGLRFSRRGAAGAVAVAGLAFLAGRALWRRGGPSLDLFALESAVRTPTAAEEVVSDAAGAPLTLPAGISAALTATADFYTISKNITDPKVSAAGWSLSVGGLVRTPLRLSYDDLRALPSTDLIGTLACISNPVGGDLISTTRWSGARLADLLERAGVDERADWLAFTAADGYVERLPLDQARAPLTLLVHSMDGAPLTDKHGFPVRLYTPGLYGMKNPKWIEQIEAVTSPKRGYWERQGWDPGRGVETLARFDTRPVEAVTGVSTLLGGIAFTGDRGVRAVELSADDGARWAAARLAAPLSGQSWTRWAYLWTPEQAGRHTLLVRAVDGDGVTQPAAKADTFPSGATGYHRIAFSVRAG